MDRRRSGRCCGRVGAGWTDGPAPRHPVRMRFEDDWNCGQADAEHGHVRLMRRTRPTVAVIASHCGMLPRMRWRTCSTT